MNRRICFYTFLAISLFANINFLFAKEPSGSKELLSRLLFFYSEGCHACQKVKYDILPSIEKEFFDKIIIEYLDIADIGNYKMMLSLKEKYKCFEEGVPTIFFEGTILVGDDQIREKLKNTIQVALEKGIFEKWEELPGIDLVKHFLSFGLVAIIIAGLIDGINPCAFTVIVFFVSFLAFQGYRKKELLIIGLSFVCAVFLTYVLVGLGIFEFLYSINKFYIITKILYYLIAAFCFILAIFATYDLWVFKKTGKTDGLTLQLPQAVKNRIHSIIGLHYRKSRDQKSGSVSKSHLLRLIASAFITGFLVSLLEAVCTGQVYLPTISFILKYASSFRVRAFTYLLLYNIMFIVPLLIVLIFALFGTTSESFSRFVKKHMEVIKLSMALLFLGLGILILMKA